MIEGVTRKERTDADGKTTSTTEIKCASRQAALAKFTRINAMYKDRIEVTDGDGMAAKIEAKRLARLERRAATLKQKERN